MSSIQKVISSPTGSIFLSIILGLGLAAIFRKACKGNDCIVVKAPRASDVDKLFFKIDHDCYKYEPRVTSCSAPPRPGKS